MYQICDNLDNTEISIIFAATVVTISFITYFFGKCMARRTTNYERL